MCPACFNISPEDADKSIGISLDGNLQHTRFKDKVIWEFEQLNPKLFVDYQRRDYARAADAIAAAECANEVDDGVPCGNLFKATKGWNRTEAATASKKALDESGVVVATCYHGVALRFLNMHSTGERHTHAHSILANISEEVRRTIDPEDCTTLNICYDIACVFERAIYRLMPKERERLRVRIGRFHQFAHGIGCHINYSTMRTDGYGLMVGEEPEQIWFQMSSLIRSGRVSSGPRRTQKIDSWGLYNSQRMQSILGQNIHRRWAKMGMMRANANAVLQKLLGVILPDHTNPNGSGVQITSEYLEDQIKNQIKYYENFS